jgi:hypothetical protein
VTIGLLGWIIAGIIGAPGAFLLFHFIKQNGSLRTENESLKKTDAVKDKQMAVAARPAASGSAILNELSNDNL